MFSFRGPKCCWTQMQCPSTLVQCQFLSGMRLLHDEAARVSCHLCRAR